MRFTTVILCVLFCLKAGAEVGASDAALEAAAEQLVAESAPKVIANVEDLKAEEKTEEKAELKESEIPVVLTKQAPSKSESNLLIRLVASLGVILVVSGVAMYASKRWARQKDKGGQGARIEMMHQFHMGPKKSVALIRVAGEAILIGVTDHNINMLKSVALIDDELSNSVNKDFNNFLEEDFSIEDVRNALGPRA